MRPLTEESPDGPGQDDKIAPERPVLDVVVVEEGAILDGGVSSEPVNLGPAGQASGYPMPLVVSLDRQPELVHEMRTFRPRTDKRHVSSNDVHELRQLVQAGFPENPPNSRDARIFGHGPSHVRVVVDLEGSELEELEENSPLAHPPLAEEHRAGAGDLHRCRYQGEDWHRQSEQEGRYDEVEDTLGPPREHTDWRPAEADDRDSPDVFRCGAISGPQFEETWDEVDLHPSGVALSEDPHDVWLPGPTKGDDDAGDS